LKAKNKERRVVKLFFRFVLTGTLLAAALVSFVHFAKEAKLRELASQPLPVPSTDSYPVPKVTGVDDALVKLVEFSDFQCPSCRFASGAMHELMEKYPGKIQFQYKHFPLSSHKWSLYAHQAAECMHIQGKFWPFHDKLYETQQEWTKSTIPPAAIFIQYAREMDANMELFTSCMADMTVTKGIYAEKEEGKKRQEK